MTPTNKQNILVFLLNAKANDGSLYKFPIYVGSASSTTFSIDFQVQQFLSEGFSLEMEVIEAIKQLIKACKGFQVPFIGLVRLYEQERAAQERADKESS